MSQESKPKVAEHPVAARQIARARAWGALIGFALAFWLSRRAGLPFPESGGRALVAGFACRLLAWAAVVTVWRQLIPAQIAAARQRSLMAGQQAGSGRGSQGTS
jgi:hypothetical protein